MTLPLSILERDMGDAQLFFMHIPKTAGATLIQALEQQFCEYEIARWLYPFCLIEQPKDFFARYRYFHGHVQHELMRSFLLRPPETITILRDPVEQYLSQFGNHKRVSLSQIPDWTAQLYEEFQKTSLHEFVFDPPEGLRSEARNWQNKQSKMLSFTLEEWPDSRVSDSSPFLLGSKHVFPTPTAQFARSQLDRFSFFGLTERLQETLLLLSYTFGWAPLTDYETVNDAPKGGRPYQHELRPDMVAELLKLNGIDCELYAYANRVFQERFDQMCRELLERHGKRHHANLRWPLPQEAVVELLDSHYSCRFAERTPAVPSLRFELDQKLSGRNWQVRERDAAGFSYRWSGPGRLSSLDLPITPDVDIRLRFAIVMSISDAILDTLITRVNDQVVKVTQVTAEEGPRIFEGHVGREVLQRWPGRARLSLEVSRTVPPLEVIPGSRDGRLLGIALGWVEIQPVRAAQS